MNILQEYLKEVEDNGGKKETFLIVGYLLARTNLITQLDLIPDGDNEVNIFISNTFKKAVSRCVEENHRMFCQILSDLALTNGAELIEEWDAMCRSGNQSQSFFDKIAAMLKEKLAP